VATHSTNPQSSSGTDLYMSATSMVLDFLRGSRGERGKASLKAQNTPSHMIGIRSAELCTIILRENSEKETKEIFLEMTNTTTPPSLKLQTKVSADSYFHIVYDLLAYCCPQPIGKR